VDWVRRTLTPDFIRTLEKTMAGLTPNYVAELQKTVAGIGPSYMSELQKLAAATSTIELQKLIANVVGPHYVVSMLGSTSYFRFKLSMRAAVGRTASG
jgi:hypothetical protein